MIKANKKVNGTKRYIDGVLIKRLVTSKLLYSFYECEDGHTRAVSNFENRIPYPEYMCSVDVGN
jgi:hypothetical protein